MIKVWCNTESLVSFIPNITCDSYKQVFIFCYQEKLEKTKADEVMMQEEQKRLSKEIETWEKKFVKQNGREPTEEEK